MNFRPSGYHQQVLYQTDPNLIQSLKSIRDKVHNICKHHVNQFVKVETLDGQVYVGRIVNCERGFLYLGVPNQGVHRSPYYNNELILTLVLYELLVITLLYT